MEHASDLFHWLPYLTAAALFLGLLRRLRRWRRAAARPAPLFPVPDATPAVWAKIAAEVCRLGGRRNTFTSGIVAAWSLHAALLLLAVGHCRAVADFPGLWAVLGLTVQDVDAFGAVAGSAAGFVALAAVAALAVRRLASPAVRVASRPQDFLALALLAAVVASGLFMRLAGRTELADVRAYFAALAALRPGPMPQAPGFAVHFLLAQALAVYLPWGKLLHAFGVFPAKAGLRAATFPPADAAGGAS